MQTLPLQTTIGAGKDRQIERIFGQPYGRLVQVTLRNENVFEAHKAAVSITIQCVAGSGTITTESGGEAVELTAGVLVSLAANEVHEVKATPSVSILLTFFTNSWCR